MNTVHFPLWVARFLNSKVCPPSKRWWVKDKGSYLLLGGRTSPKTFETSCFSFTRFHLLMMWGGARPPFRYFPFVPSAGQESFWACNQIQYQFQCTLFFVLGMQSVVKTTMSLIASVCDTMILLNWLSEMDTLKINLLWGREGYGGFEYTDEKLSARRIQLCRDLSSIFIFGGIFEE